MNLKVSFNDVSKKYSLTTSKKEKITDMFFPNKSKSSFYGVRNISFDVMEGETIGFVGINGSGKSTMSNLLARMIPPTSGEIEMDGQPSLIAIAAGLNNSLTGKDNIYLKCLMMGFTKREIEEMYDSIVEFADIGEFIDQPVKNYSSGMKSRLGFAISIHNDPDILIIDEALSVGDQTFYQKCVDRITEFKKQGKTIFFVSHSIGQIEKICDRVIWMHYGELKMFDETKVVVAEYKKFIERFNKLSKEEKVTYQTRHKEGRKRPLESKDNSSRLISKSSKSKKGNHTGIMSKLQLSILAVLILLSGASLFIDQPLKTIASANLFAKETMSVKEAEKEKSIEETAWENVNAEGIILNEETTLYADDSLKKESELKLPFGNNVGLIAQNANVAKIEYENEQYFINKEDVSSFTSESGEVVTSRFAPYFSETVQSSYEFLMAFMGSDASDLEENVNGGEMTEFQGQPALYLPYEGIYYLIEQDKVTGIVINDMEELEPENVNLTEEDVVYSNNKQQYFIRGEGFDYIINNKDNSITIMDRSSL
ncbi:ABC transporter ATP-binding protein [Niallia sp.]|uniref:ABC transporter ATP-binding protein n=1 Tax=Niallia sp. TaxID=2837523 RepID=UPI00289BAF5C|nr:ABC transporter ATP-binding protein [Niallia sp.]